MMKPPMAANPLIDAVLSQPPQPSRPVLVHRFAVTQVAVPVQSASVLQRPLASFTVKVHGSAVSGIIPPQAHSCTSTHKPTERQPWPSAQSDSAAQVVASHQVPA